MSQKVKTQKLTAYTLFFENKMSEVRYFTPSEFAGFKKSKERKKCISITKTAECTVITKIKIF